MEIRCNNCQRSFAVDEHKAKTLRAAKCVCGTRLSLGSSAGPAAGPHRLGKYLLLRRIAVGGMGEIYYGKIAGIEGFERDVAIKKMLPHLAEDRAFVDMMVKEAKLTVLLRHPNIVQVYNLAREANEIYIAMEYVPGITVGHMLELCHGSGTRLPVEVAVHIAMQVLRGLAYAHDLRDSSGEPMHLLHRDITPQNILVTSESWVKITDFGIAKARNEISTTSPGMIKGKLGYIAPEQLAGQNPDQRMDIFCVGILLWEALATQRLFKGVDEIDTFRMIAEAKVPALSTFRDDVPAAVEAALRGSLTRLPDHRFKTADEFYTALSQAIAPSTADDYAAAAKRYLAAHPQLFDSVVKAGADDSPTTGELAPPEGEVLPAITELAATPPRRPVVLKAVVAAAALFVALAAGALLWPKAARQMDAGPVTAQAQRLTQREVQLAVNGETTRLLECYRAGNTRFRKLGRMDATLTIASTGGVANVTLEPAASELGRVGPCAEGVLRALRFRPHPDASFEAKVDLPAPQTTPGAVATGGTPEGGSPAKITPLTQAEVQKVISGAQPSFAKCVADIGEALDLNAKISVGANGRVAAVGFDRSVGVAAVDACLRKSVQGLRFRKQEGEWEVTIPLRLRPRT